MLISNNPTLTAVQEESREMPEKYVLSQNYPNPFNPTTNIEFQIPNGGFVTLKVFDLLGKQVRTLLNTAMNAGSYRVTFDGNGLSSGMYFYRLQCGNFSSTKKLLRFGGGGLSQGSPSLFQGCLLPASRPIYFCECSANLFPSVSSKTAL